jgi:transposase InsO family protein
VEHLEAGFEVSERRACEVVEQPRSTQRYEPQEADDEGRIVTRMLELVRAHPRYGYRRIWVLLRREGIVVNRKRIYRLWKQEGLKVPKKQRKKRRMGSSDNGCVRHRATRKDQVWAWDFVHDRTTDGRPLKWLTLVDEYTRECLALRVGRSIKAQDAIDVLAEVFAMHGVPEHVRSDNGPEFIATAMRDWLQQVNVGALYIEPGSPWENGYAESFNSKFRDEFLNAEEFDTEGHARAWGAAWQADYNDHRPHSALGYVTPSEFARTCAASVRAAPSLQQHTSAAETILS